MSRNSSYGELGRERVYRPSLSFQPHRAGNEGRRKDHIKAGTAPLGFLFSERALGLIEGGPQRPHNPCKPRSGRKPTKRDRTIFVKINKSHFQTLVQELTGVSDGAVLRKSSPLLPTEKIRNVLDGSSSPSESRGPPLAAQSSEALQLPGGSQHGTAKQPETERLHGDLSNETLQQWQRGQAREGGNEGGIAHPISGRGHVSSHKSPSAGEISLEKPDSLQLPSYCGNLLESLRLSLGTSDNRSEALPECSRVTVRESAGSQHSSDWGSLSNSCEYGSAFSSIKVKENQAAILEEDLRSPGGPGERGEEGNRGDGDATRNKRSRSDTSFMSLFGAQSEGFDLEEGIPLVDQCLAKVQALHRKRMAFLSDSSSMPSASFHLDLHATVRDAPFPFSPKQGDGSYNEHPNKKLKMSKEDLDLQVAEILCRARHSLQLQLQALPEGLGLHTGPQMADTCRTGCGNGVGGQVKEGTGLSRMRSRSFCDPLLKTSFHDYKIQTILPSSSLPVLDSWQPLPSCCPEDVADPSLTRFDLKTGLAGDKPCATLSQLDFGLTQFDSPPASELSLRGAPSTCVASGLGDGGAAVLESRERCSGGRGEAAALNECESGSAVEHAFLDLERSSLDLQNSMGGGWHRQGGEKWPYENATRDVGFGSASTAVDLRAEGDSLGGTISTNFLGLGHAEGTACGWRREGERWQPGGGRSDSEVFLDGRNREQRELETGEGVSNSKSQQQTVEEQKEGLEWRGEEGVKDRVSDKTPRLLALFS